jgi:signal transduction histidine kinase
MAEQTDIFDSRLTVPEDAGWIAPAQGLRDPRLAGRPPGPGQHRSSARRTLVRSIPAGSFHIGGIKPVGRGQRSIRSAISWLLILPIVTMIGLYAYAVSGAIGPAVAKQRVAAVNAAIGAPDAYMQLYLEKEQSDTFIWQASYHRAPGINLKADYALTDKYVAELEVGLAKVRGTLNQVGATSGPLLQGLSARLRLRTVAANLKGTAGALNAFEGYNSILDVIETFSNSLINLNGSIAEVQESKALIFASEGTVDMAEISTLLGGVLTSGSTMTPGEYQLFASLYYDQVDAYKSVDDPFVWQVSPDPYYQSSLGPGQMNTPLVQSMLALEREVLRDGSNKAPAKLPVTPAQVRQTFGAALAANGPMQKAENISRVGVTANFNQQGDLILWRLALVGIGGLLVVILSTFLLLRFGNRITRELTGLRNAARTLSGKRLPSVVRRLRAGEDVDVAAEAPPLELKTKTREVSDTADAFSAVQHTAIEAAVEQATLRRGVSNVFRSLARRNQSLLQQQLKMLDEMERNTQDPDALSQLFRLDHLTTRMRRQAEGLIILSGSGAGRRWRQPVPVIEVLRGAISEIEDYVRVDLGTASPDYLTGAAVADVTHLLAELIENAAAYSPPATRVQVRVGRMASGYVIEVEDHGLGISPEARDQLNERLASPPDFDLTNSDQLGLFVVGRLAVRNQIKVSLRDSGFGGTTAIVLLPGSLVVSEDKTRARAAQDTPHGTALAASAFGAGARYGDRRAPSGQSAGGWPPPSQGGDRGAFGTPAPFQDAPAVPAPADPSPFSAAGDGGQFDGASSSGLPKRQKTAGLAPQWQGNRPGAAQSPLAGRSPEQARSLLSSIQRGLRAGRESEVGGGHGNAPPDVTGNGPATGQDPSR